MTEIAKQGFKQNLSDMLQVVVVLGAGAEANGESMKVNRAEQGAIARSVSGAVGSLVAYALAAIPWWIGFRVLFAIHKEK